jgi:S-adenosylmethionine/arginine decarboxylase-like enzyme
MKTPMHKHLLLRGMILDAPTSEQVVIDWLREFVDKIGMKVVQGPFASMITEEGNRGLTASVMIETSHIAFHIWDETNPGLIQFDLYTCSELNSPYVFKELEKFFNFTEYQYMILDRQTGFKVIEGCFSS